MKLVLFSTIAIFKNAALFTVKITQSFIDTEKDQIRWLEVNLYGISPPLQKIAMGLLLIGFGIVFNFDIKIDLFIDKE